MITHPLHLAVLGALLVVSCATDVAWRRVPNFLVVGVAAGGVLAQWGAGGVWSVVAGLVAGLAVAVFLVGLWSAGKVGGGDVKLVSAVSIWVGPERLPGFLVATGLAAAALGLVVLATSRSEMIRVLRALAGAPPPPGASAAVRKTVPVAVGVTLAAAVVLSGRPT